MPGMTGTDLGSLKPRAQVPRTEVFYTDFWPDDWREREASWRWPSAPGTVCTRPEIVTLCGSTRFVEQFNEWRQKLTLAGCMVFSIEIVTTQQRNEDPQHVNRPNKVMLDLLHFEKIRHSDRIFVLNVGGYMGESTRAEVQYAQFLGVPIEYLEKTK